MGQSDKMIQDKMLEIERLLCEFKEKFENGTSSADNFLSLHEIEEMWGKLRGSTDNLYSDMVQELMANVDERGLVRKKKENTGEKASG